METPPLSILKKLGRLPNPKYGNVFDIFRKQTPPQPEPPQPEQPQNNNDTNIKISSQEEVSPDITTSMTTMSTMSTDLDSMSTTPSTPSTPKTPLLTEDTGKILEKAICDVYGTPYDGAFVYSQEEVDKLIPRVSNLKTDNHFPQCHHTASNGARYDFASDDGAQNLSAKSNKKKGGKVAPQVIGQPSAEKFCQVIGIQDPATIAALASSPPQLKQYIQEHIAAILPVMWEYTFSCPIVYYVANTGDIRFITETHTTPTPTPIDWNSYEYTWTRTHDKWENSTTLKISPSSPSSQPNEKPVSIAEFQFHTKSRTNLAIRWNFEAVLKLFHTRFAIVAL
jgi:hypothetical protein